MPLYGQIVIGPPGSGKSTYCTGMKEHLTHIGRKVAVVNLDPANDTLPYESAINIQELISLTDVMENLKLGPNGGLIYCMEYLEQNWDWLKNKVLQLKDRYLLFDFPGQVELYTHHNSVRNVIQKLQKLDLRLVAVHLVDSHYCSDPSKFISVLLTSLSTMLQLELPHINILSKIDLIEQYGKLAFSLDYYTEVLDLQFLLDHLQDDPLTRRYKKLNEALVGLIEDYGLVTFQTLNIQDKESMNRVTASVDKCNGYIFGGSEEESNFTAMMSSAMGAEFELYRSASVQEKYMKDDVKDS